MKKLICVLFLMIFHLSPAQEFKIEKPDYEIIKINIQKNNSNLFYDVLLKRFLESDSTMTWVEKRHLYYGYSFHKNYQPYGISNYMDSLRSVSKKVSLEVEDYSKIIKYTNEMLNENPFDLKALNYQLFALENKGDQANFNKRLVQLGIIFDAILSSGNGTSKKEAFYVIDPSHEYEILQILGFNFGGSQKLIDHYDYLTLEKNDANLKGLYFDVSRSLNSMFKSD